MVVHYVLDVSHNLCISSLGPGGRGIDRLTRRLKDGGGLRVQHERDC
jgi:hypothetical protein